MNWMLSRIHFLDLTAPTDGGPIYTETDLGRTVAEPWNAITAALFLGIVLIWVLRLRGQYRRYAFLSCALPLLAAGGIGGTLYHAFRISHVFFLLDVLPIYLLGLATSLYLWLRLAPRWWHLAMIVALYGAAYGLLRGLEKHVLINLSYAFMAALILAMLAMTLNRTYFRHAAWVLASTAAFAVALFFRQVDPWQPPVLPMGTHWLWHVFGAMSVQALAEFLFRIQRDSTPAHVSPFVG